LTEQGAAVARLQRALARYGYGIETTNIFDPMTMAVITAFQRHFRPGRIDGKADPSTRHTLSALLAARGMDSGV
jgi:N-acetyl-anhydromuramyl-L-alanine amidase AmpD